MIEITATGDTTLHTAGKYCEEDILVKVPGGAHLPNITLDAIATKAIAGDVSLSVATIGSYAFHGYTKLTSLFAPNVTIVGEYAFYQATGLKGAIALPNCTSVGSYAFYKTTGITSVDLPLCKTIGGNAFNGVSAVNSLNLPVCTAIPASSFTSANVTKLVLPECTSIGNSALTNCKNLKYVDLPKCTSLASYALRNNSNLETLILRSETMCTASSYVLNSTKIMNGTGYVYVPRALIASYQTANIWKNIYAKNANAFRALEDYTVDGTLTGEIL